MKKFKFYSMVQKDGKKTVEMQEGYTDGEFNYYSKEKRHWFCIDPQTGLSVAIGTSKEKAQQNVPKLKFEEMKKRDSYKMLVKEFDKLRLYGGEVNIAI